VPDARACRGTRTGTRGEGMGRNMEQAKGSRTRELVALKIHLSWGRGFEGAHVIGSNYYRILRG
jgi:hypothetical protein